MVNYLCYRAHTCTFGGITMGKTFKSDYSGRFRHNSEWCTSSILYEIIFQEVDIFNICSSNIQRVITKTVIVRCFTIQLQSTTCNYKNILCSLNNWSNLFNIYIYIYIVHILNVCTITVKSLNKLKENLQLQITKFV